MPNLCVFKQIKGKMYVWDKDKKTFFRVRLETISDPEEASEVITAYMEELRTRREETNDN